MADFIVAADNAKFIMAFVNLGLVPDTGGAYLLAKSIGEKRAMELCIMGRPVRAQEAKDLGFVYKVVAWGRYIFHQSFQLPSKQTYYENKMLLKKYI